MPNKEHTYTPCSYNESAARELLADGSFIEAFVGAFRLLGVAFVSSPKTEDFARVHETLLKTDIDCDWPFGKEEARARAATLLTEGAAQEDEAALLRAYTRLFRGPAHLEAPPWGSVYMDRDQVLYGWTWVELRTWIRQHGFVASYEENDPEDNFGRMLLLACEVAQSKPELLCEFLGNHLLCWAPRFLTLLEHCAQSPSYTALALLADTSLSDIAELFGIEPAKKKLFFEG